jgi:hypothetical protein
MDSFVQIKDSMNASKAPTKKKIKMKDVFANSKTPNKVITMMTGYKY